MADDLHALETLARPLVFLLVFAAMAAWEILAPRRTQSATRWSRWPSNLGILAVDVVVLRLLFPLTAVAWAGWVARHGLGLLQHVDLPAWLGAVVAFMLLDLAIYLQHRLLHAVPLLWRLHRMHHADTEFDITNGLRFHPLEIGLSMLVKFAAIAAIGAPPWSVLVFEIALNATSIFNHGNVRLAPRIDRILRRFVVTPDMHRVHHSVRRDETDSNFGFNLPWWDRWLGSYRDQPLDGHVAMRIGLAQFRHPRWRRLDRMLIQPWASSAREDE